MATLDLDHHHANYQIRSYQPGIIRINETSYHQSLIVTPTRLIDHWNVPSVAYLTALLLSELIPLKPDIVLIGTGETLVFPPQAVYGELINKNIGVEIMNTAAACRTFNALSSEDRQVAAALIIR